MASRLRGRRRAIVTAVVAIVLLGAGGSAWALSSGGGPSYRMATVTRGSVAQTLTATGTIAPVRSADLDFQVSGTVGKVYVKAGSKVRAGRRLASLDRTALRSSLRSARSTLSQARADLASDENRQASAATTTSSASTAPTQSASPQPSQATTSPSPKPSSKPSPSPAPSSGSNPVSKQLLARIHRDQAALIADQQQADADLATAKSALKAETTACAAELSGDGSGTPGGTGTSDDTAACVAATKTLLADQQTVQADQQAVSKAEAALDADLSAAIGAATSSAPAKGEDTVWSAERTRAVTVVAAVATTSVVTVDVADEPSPTSTVSPTTAGSTSGSTSGSSTYTGGGSTVTASTLASDQATIDSDRADVASARADLAQATLRAPISGRIAAITIHRGSTADGSSSSTSPAIKIVGSRQSKVTVDVTPTQVRELKVGISARVTPDGTDTDLAGTVALIGQASTDASTGDTTYPVTITLSSRPKHLVSGAAAEVAITLSQRTDVIVVPTSAVHHNGSQTYVETESGGTLNRIAVRVGSVGAAVTQITSGLVVGQRVVLANLDAAVPSSSSNLTTGSGGLGGFTRGGSGFGSGGVPSFSGGNLPAPPSGASFGGG